jgi:deoxycytidylate deaminase
MKKETRPDIDEYFLKIASVVAERSTCRRHHVGAVAVKDKHILATGYNGAAAAWGLPFILHLAREYDRLRQERGQHGIKRPRN